MKDKALYAELLRLMAPLALGSMLQQLYNTVGAVIVGRCIGSDEFAAVGIASSAANLFLFAAVGACIGVSVILSQLYGAGDLAAFRREHYTALKGGIAVFAMFAAAGAALSAPILELLQTPSELKRSALIYLVTALAALPASYAYNFYSALLRSVKRVAVPLAILALSVLLNMLLALIFINDLGMGVFGAALSTVCAQVFAAVLSAVYSNRAMPQLRCKREERHFDKALAKKTLAFAGVTALQQTGLYIGKLFVQGAVNSMGTAYISAYTATTRIEGFANSFGDSGASAASVLTGHSYGAGEKERLRDCLKVSCIIMCVSGVIISLALYVFAAPLCDLMLGESGTESCAQAEEYMRTVALFYVLCFSGNAFAGYFDGIGKMSVSMAGSLGHIALRIVLSWLLIEKFGLAAVALATGIGWLGVNIFWMIKYMGKARQRAKTVR